MIRHVVVWKFKDEAEGHSARENRARVAQALRALPREIPGILEWEVGEVEADRLDGEQVELCLISLFENRQHLAAYSAHPRHAAVVDLLRRVRSEKRVADYETLG